MYSRFIAACMVLLAVLMTSPEASAGDAVECDIRISRQPVPAAIGELATQCNVSVFSDVDKAAEIMVNAVSGRYSVDTALTLLLSGTGLVAEMKNPRIFAIRRLAVTEPPAAPNGRSNEVFVMGRRGRTEYGSAGEEPSVSPPSVHDEEKSFERFGLSSAGDLLKYSPAQLYFLPETTWGDGAQYLDLRGLGVDLAMVRINGQWVAPGATSGLAFDLAAIPSAAVERVDILDESAAAALGVSAIGGVANIVLKRDYSSPTATFEYGAAQGGGIQRELSVRAGFDKPALKASLLANYFERTELRGDQRDFWSNQDFRRFGGSDWRSVASSPGNITSASSAPLPGLSSQYATVPVGTSDGAVSIDDFRATAGQYGLDSSRRFSSIAPAVQRLSVVGHVERSFRKVDAYMDVLGARRFIEYQFTPPTLNSALVPASNAFNPFGVAVLSSRLMLEVPPRQFDTEAELLRLVGGLKGPIGSWVWRFSALTSQESATRSANNAFDPQLLARALASSDPSQALNVFTSGSAGSPELIASLIAPRSSVRYLSVGTEIAGTLQGPLLTLPGGEATASLGAQWRKEITSSERRVTAWHAGLQLPLWTPQLRARLGARSDHFSDIGEVTTPNYSLEWQPWPALTLSGSYAESFRPPSSYELFGPNYGLQVPVVDRRRNNELASITATVGSSTELKPVKGRSLTLRANFKPSAGLELEGSYWLKRVVNRIMPVALSLALEHEAAFAGRIVRDEPTPQERDMDLPGVLRSVDLSMINVGGIEASGVDVEISCRFDTDLGAFKSELLATWVNGFSTFDVPGEEATDRVGVANALGTIPRWRATVSIGWQQRERLAEISASARYVGTYDDMNGGRRTGRSVRQHPLVDIQASLDLGEFTHQSLGFRGVTITIGALNVFDMPPHFAEVGQDLGYDPSMSDPRQFFGYVRIQKRF